jgi:hypothetical protein
MHLIAMIAAGVLVVGVAGDITREQAQVFQQKLSRIRDNAQAPSSKPRETPMTQDEVNSYLRYAAGPLLPVGVTDPSITIQSEGRLAGRAIVDLDAIRRQKSRGWLDPTAYLTGSLPLTAVGVLRTDNGRGQFTLEGATISGIPIPKTFLQEIVSYYSRNDDFPNGINIDDPFELPAEIKKIDVAPGRAVIVQ